MHCADTQIPSATTNPLLAKLFPSHRRVVVFNKADLADRAANDALREKCRAANLEKETRCTYRLLSTEVNARSPDGYWALFASLRRAAENVLSERIATQSASVWRYGDAGVVRPVRMLVIGVPNVGKSTLINNLRGLGGQASAGSGRKAVPTGSLAGVTRAVSGLIRVMALRAPSISPVNEPSDNVGFEKSAPRSYQIAPLTGDEHIVYVHDTPGVLLPRISSPHQGLLLAITGALMDSTLEGHLLVDFLHHAIAPPEEHAAEIAAARPEVAGNSSDPFVRHYGIAPGYEDVMTLLDAIAVKTNAVHAGRPNRAVAIANVLKAFRTGEMGRYTLEPIGSLSDSLEGSVRLVKRRQSQ